MFDSFPKFPVGILYGNHYELGNFDECIGSKQILTGDYEEDELIQGRYCLTDIHFKNKYSSSSLKTAENMKVTNL